MPRIFAFSILMLVIVSSASAQIIYEPVQSQYSAGGTTYYYGGSDPRVHAYAKRPFSSGGTWGRVNGWAFVSANRQVANEPERVFTNTLGLVNAHLLGFTPSDASNEANANMPRYFVKRELLNAAIIKDGAYVVPAQAHPIAVYKSDGTLIEPGPTTMPRPLLIIPKALFDNPRNRPAPAASDKLVAHAG